MKAKNILVKIAKCFVCFCLAADILYLAVYVGGGIFGTVERDAGYLGRGYGKSISYTYPNTERFNEIVGKKLSAEDYEQIGENMKWKGKDVWTEYTDSTGKKYKIAGKRVWYGKYKWQSAE